MRISCIGKQIEPPVLRNRNINQQIQINALYAYYYAPTTQLLLTFNASSVEIVPRWRVHFIYKISMASAIDLA